MIAGAKAREEASFARVRPQAATRTAGAPASADRETPPPAPLSSGPLGRDRFLSQLEQVSSRIHDPAAKLKFLRESLARKESLNRQVQAVPVGPLRLLLSRVFGLDRIQHLLHRHDLTGGLSEDAPSPGVRVGLTAGIALLAALSASAFLLMRTPSREALAAVLGQSAARPGSAGSSQAGAPVPASGLRVVVPARGVRPERIWLVEKSPTHELWSNGLRVDTRFSVMGTPRAFRELDRKQGLLPEVHTSPVGILFHTSESDVWPLEASFNENLRDSTQKLLRYLQRNTTYHYLIDRFGRVWKVVDDGSKANHAGHSVWATGENVFLNLNHGFLGVSFETRWEGGRALPITEAQFAAGRQLSDQLRQRYAILPEMCVAHGLTSVNPKLRLIGHHLDWARGFPFEAFGLPDQYRVPSPAVALFGFGYDEEFLRVMQEPWPGVRSAEAALDREARAGSSSLETVKLEKQKLYDRWIADQERADEAQASTPEVSSPASPGRRED